MVGPVYLTKAGREALEAELHDLVHNQRPAVIARIKAAKELGDLRENADYEIARNEQSFIEGKVLEIEEKLRNAEMIDENASTDQVGLGSTVEVTAERKTRLRNLLDRICHTLAVWQGDLNLLADLLPKQRSAEWADV